MFLTLVVGAGVLSPDMWGAARSTAPDALLENQWHLKDRTVELAGANVRNAWPSSQGAGVVIGIVDDGLQYTHPDLSPNYLASASWDFNFNDGDPYPTGSRGTAVAGIAAARGDNTIGVSGVAPQASLAGLRLTALAPTDAQEAGAFGYLPQVIAILNNAWNPSDNGATLKGPGPLAKAARQNAVATGRNGKGRIFVWPSGDGRLNSDDCNFDGYANSRFAISVAAADDGGYASSQTERCAALTVLAPAGLGSRALTTTDLLGSSGYDASDYTSQYGTSLTGGGASATGTVSGAVALMLSRNPNLGWRDVKDILRRTSIRLNPTDPEWTPGPFPHSQRLGFGLIDVEAAVDMSGSWVNLPAEEALTPPTETVNLAIPDTNPTGITDTITISAAESNFVIEHVEVDFSAIHPWRGDITVTLTSPAGVISNLATIRPNDFNDNYSNWTFGSVRHWGEPAAGVWTLRVADPKFRDVGTWTSWTLRIYGRHLGLGWPGTFSKTSPANGATGQSTSPTLSWGQSADATTYEYCIDTSNNNVCNATWISTGANTSVGLSGLSSNTAYYWHVRAINGTGTTYANGNSTAFWSFSTPPTLPGAFVHSSPANGATGQSSSPTLSWTASSGATSYEYCYDTSNNSACNATWISTGLGTSVALSGLASGTAYYWHVRANNGGGTTYADGASTLFWNFTTTVAAPGAFSLTSPANGSNNQPTNPTLDWGTSSGATSYEYCIDTTNNNACNTSWISTGATSSVALSGLPNNTPHYWHVRANNAGGTTYAEGAATAFRTFTTVVAAPGAFGHNSPGNGATGLATNPTLGWSTSSGAASYEYCIDTTNNSACDASWTLTGTNTSVALSSLAPNTTHYWQVRATNAGGTTYADGAATAYWNFTTVVAAPGAFSHTSPSNGAANQPTNPLLDWGSSAGATNYEYCIDTTNDSACSGWTSTGTSTSVSLSGLANGAVHFWHVRATNAGGTTYAEGATTSFWNFTTVVAAPGAFSHTSPSNGAANQPTNPLLDWGSSAGATNYEYCIDTTNDSACSGWTSTGTSTSVSLSGLANGAVHFWHVRATNAGGTTYAEGATTSYWTFTTVVSAPAAFVHSSPSNGAANQPTNPTLDWAPSSGATSYEYCIDTSNNNACNTSWTSTGASTSVALSGLPNSTPHYWHVRAINTGGTTYADGAATSFWSFTTAGVAPAAFGHTSPANDATNQPIAPTLSWSASAGATSYEYCIDTSNNNACNTSWISTGANTSIALSGLSNNQLHAWQVRAINASGTTYAEGAAASYWTFTTVVAAPGAFVHSSPSNAAANQSLNPNLDWSSSSGATSYEYCIDTTNNGACNTSWISTGTTSEVTLSNLPANTLHSWQVRAINAGGTTYANGSLDSFWTFTTIVAPPGSFSHTSPANAAASQSTSPTLSWGASAGATSYEYCIDTTNNNSCNGWTSAGANTSVALSGLANNTPHYWHVRAANGGGTTYAEGASTAFWSFTTVVPAPGAFDHTSPSDGATDQPVAPIISWGTSAGATSYEYCVDSTNDDACTTWIGVGTNTNVSLTGLTAGTAYFWHVRALNAGGTTYASETAASQGTPTSFWSFVTLSDGAPVFDLDGGGLGDVFTYNPQTGAWKRQISLPGGGFQETSGTWAAGWLIFTASFNSDALTDLFLINPSSGWWFKMVNTGSSFAEHSTGTWWPGWQKFVMDLDGDGISDLFLYDPATGQWYKCISTPAGFDYYSGWWMPGWEVTPMNLNGDAYGDLFLIDRTSGRWFWVVGEAGGSFTYPQESYWAPDWNLHPGDFDGNGKTDLFLYRPGAGEYYVAMNNGAGYTYSSGAGWLPGWTPTLGDLNGDGLADLFLYNKNNGKWAELLGDGAGQFSLVGLGNWSGGWDLHPGDFNGDGRTDLLLYKPATGEWYQALNYAIGSFTYFNGQWQTGLTIIGGLPVR